MKNLDLNRLRRDLKSALTGEMLIRTYCPNVDISSAKQGDEYKINCCLPGHNDDTPSLFISSSKFVYNCKGKCSADISSGDFIKFIQVMDNVGFVDALKKACDICGIPISVYSDEKKVDNTKKPDIDIKKVKDMHDNLINNKNILTTFCKIRNLSKEDIINYKIGIDKHGNYSLPIKNKDGKLISIKYRHKDVVPPKKIPKYWFHKEPKVNNPKKNKKSDWWRYGDTYLFEIDKLINVDNDCKIIITGGEFDAIQINRLNIKNVLAISSSSGEGSWSSDWNKYIIGKNVYICFDNDDKGRSAAKDLKKIISNSKIIDISKKVDTNKGDITDFFKAGYTIDDLFSLVEHEEEHDNSMLDIINTLKETKVESVNPAFFIDNNVVYITSMFEREKQTELKDGSIVTFKTNEPMIISSNRGVYEIPRIDKEIKKNDPFAVATFKEWTVKQEPQTAQTKWSGYDVISFLKGRELKQDIKEVFKDIYFSIKRYSKFYRKTYRGLVALYIMGSYFYEGFQSYPYLHLHGEKGSGKSTLGRVIAALSFNGDFVINPTVAVVARSIQEQKGLVVFDEVEQQSQRSQGRSEMGQIFNAGYQRGAKRPVCDPDNKNKRIDFDLYCPKVICNIFGLNDTTKNRCISIKMQKIKDKSNKIRDPMTDNTLLNISKKMYEIMMTKTPNVLSAYEEVKSMDMFEFIDTNEKPLVSYGRERELYTPLLSMAKFIYNETEFREPWNSLIRELRYISTEKMEDEADSPEERLRNAIRDILIERAVNEVELSMYDLVVAYKGQYVESPGNAIEHWIGRTIRKLNLCETSDKIRRKIVHVTYIGKDGIKYSERKKLMVFKITRERMEMNPVDWDNEELPF